MNQQAAETYTTFSLVLICASFYTFVSRDPLASDLGLQGPIQLGLVLTALFMLVRVAIARRLTISISSRAILFGMYCVMGTASSINSFNIRLSLGKALIVCATLIISVLLVAILPSEIILRKSYWTILALNCIGVALGIVAPRAFPLFIAESEPSTWRVRMSIFQTHPLALADLCGIAFLIGLSPLSRSYWWTQLFFFGCAAATGSRTCLAILSASLLIKTASNISTLFRLAYLISISLVVLSIGYATDIPSSTSFFTYEITGGDEGTMALNGRMPLWLYASTIWNEHFPLGFGFDGARAELMKFSDWAGHSHNSFIELYLIAGPLGWVAFMAAWASSAFRRHKYPAESALVPIHAYLALTSLIGPVVTGVAGPGLLLLSLASRRNASLESVSENRLLESPR